MSLGLCVPQTAETTHTRTLEQRNQSNRPAFFCAAIGFTLLTPSHLFRFSRELFVLFCRCIFAEMATGRPLLTGTSESDQLARIFRQMGTPTPLIYPGLQELPDYRVRQNTDTDTRQSSYSVYACLNCLKNASYLAFCLTHAAQKGFTFVLR